MDSDGGDRAASSFSELRVIETELRELLADLSTQQQTLIDERQEAWESWLAARFGDTPHAQTVANAAVADEYPATPDLKRAFRSVVGFDPDYPERCGTLTSEIDHLSAVREETRQRLHHFYRDLLNESTADRDAIESIAITDPRSKAKVLRASIYGETREVEITVVLGSSPGADRVQGTISPHTASGSSAEPPILGTDSQTDDERLPLAVRGRLGDGQLQFTVAGRLLSSLPVIYSLLQLPELYEEQTAILDTSDSP